MIKILDAATQKQLLLDYYEPSKYQGVTMTSKGSTWRNSCKGKFPFSLDLSINKHIESEGVNLAVLFSRHTTSFLGFDLDGDVEMYAIMVDSYTLTNVIEEMGFVPLVYISGGKGLHVEVRLNKTVAYDELERLAMIIKTLAENRGCQYIDKIYPSKSAYRIFGCKHYKTNRFTQIFKNGNELSEQGSWIEFQRYFTDDCRANTTKKVEKALIKYHMVKSNIKIKQKKEEPSPKGSVKEIHYSVKALKQIHTQGLYSHYTRYFSSYQLGRYFKEVLYLTEGQARAEIDKWLSRHYKTSLDYFGDAAGSKIKSNYNKCVRETIDNCMRGFSNGKSNKPNQIITFKRKTEKYVDDLKITKPQKAALRYLIRTAEEYHSLTFYHSLGQLSKGFKTSSKTVTIWIDTFIKLGLIEIISKGSKIAGKNIATTYELIIPDTYYDIEVIANNEPEILPQKKVYALCLSSKIASVHYINTQYANVHNDKNKNSHKPIR